MPDVPFDTANILDTSVIDKPFLRNLVSRSSLNSSVEENMDSRGLNDERITEEEVKLILPDGPSYRAANIKNRKTLSKHPACVVDAYLTYNPEPWSIYQEEFVKGLFKKILIMIENYMMTYSDETLAKSYRKPKTDDFVPNKLPEE